MLKDLIHKYMNNPLFMSLHQISWISAAWFIDLLIKMVYSELWIITSAQKNLNKTDLYIYNFIGPQLNSLVIFFDYPEAQHLARWRLNVSSYSVCPRENWLCIGCFWETSLTCGLIEI